MVRIKVLAQFTGSKADPVGADSGSLIKYLSSRPTPPTQGAIAQLGERIVRNDEVVGSIPTSSTKFLVSLAPLVPRECSSVT